MVTFIRRQGFAHSTLQCDDEPALVKLVEEIGKQLSLPTTQSPTISQKLEGWQRSLFTQFRALLFDFCRRCKLHPSGLMIGSSLGQHMLRHAVWLSLKASQRTSSRSSFEALLCSISFVSFKIYRLLLYGMLSFVQLAMLLKLSEQKSFKKIASNQLPQQEVKGAWYEQLASEQQPILSSLSISFGNSMMKHAAFKKKEKLYQSSLSASSLQTRLANSAQWPSFFSKNFPRVMAHQLRLQESA